MPFSIKSIERKRRSVIRSLRIKITNRNQQKPKCWNKYLQHSDNKTELVKSLIDDWSQDESSRELLSNCEMYLTYEAKSFCIRTIEMQVQKIVGPELQSEQEEADTKMYLCAQFASTLGFQSVKIVTVDSDVAILALCLASKIKTHIYHEMGTGAKVVVYDIASNTLEHDICEALPGLHSFSGSDTTSFFSGIGKTKCLIVMKTLEEWIDCMQMLGSNQKLDCVSIEKLEAFTCMLYNCNETRSIDEARYKQKLPDPHKLSPTSDALTLHLKRANYEVFEWKQALLLDHQFIDPQGNG